MAYLATCDCAACKALETEFRGPHPERPLDLAQWSYLRRNLLKPGWAGSYTAAEKAYREAHADRSEAQREVAAEMARQHGFDRQGGGTK